MMTRSNLTIFENQATPEGYKKTEVGVIPSSWKYTAIRSVTLNHKQGYYSTESYSNSGIKLARITDLKNPEIDFESMPLLQVSEKDYNFYKIKVGDILLARSGAIGRYGIVRKAEIAVFASYIIRFSLDNSQIDNDYFGYVYQSENVQKQLLTITQGSSNININAGNIKSLEVLLPDLNEQKKIATALSDTDALISEFEKLIEKKQAIKTATMQQLLTGKTRLPEFALRDDGTPKTYKDSELGQIPEDWEVYSLKSLLKSQPKYGINAAATQLSGDLPTYIRITDIDENGKFNPSEKVGVDSPLSGNYILDQGDIVLARTGASVGKSYLYDKDDGELVYAGFLIKISPAPNLLCSKYLSIYLQTKEYWDWIATNSMRSGQPGINGNQYASLKIVLPSFNEQLKISRIFKDIDRDLEQLKINLDKVTLLKQGMMQELLTGKTRLV
ncbi:restriction endonuclease subunit S [Acinetobacter bereziniae]|uniref:restriction endonuclease subunit S n=1 Tax=Acinetobacter bereziniae TaxID=106648 RepID=UPI00125F1EA4|nr:restriction endonuclease subunit S [Acinetobacter bereziniae]MDA3441926.1 restriction endonuclease subunit S [Acinetobacter bereziniae]